MKDAVILGAGIAGLGAALAAGNERSTVFEKSDYVGGNCSSFEIDGFTFDRAIHLSFTKDAFTRSLFDRTPFLTHTPEPFCYYKNLWMKYPPQSNLFPLPLEMKVKAIRDFVKRPRFRKIDNYEKWLLAQYGEFLTREFHEVYTKKHCGRLPSELSTDWIGKRMQQVALEEVLLGALSENTRHGYFLDEMRYPERGGFFAFLNTLCKEADIVLSKEAVRIEPTSKTVFFSDGERVKYQHLFCSVPMPELVGIITDVPEEIKAAARELTCTSLYLISVGFNVPRVSDHLWFHIYDKDILSSRIHFPGIKSPNNAPEGCSSLQMEYGYVKKEHRDYSEAFVRENALYSLKELGFPLDSVRFVDIRNMDSGMIAFTHNTSRASSVITRYFHSLGINPIGRYGEWKYLWSDQSFLSGYNAVSTKLGRAI